MTKMHLKDTKINFGHFPNTAQFPENFDSNIGTQHCQHKLTFEIDNLRK